MEKEKLEQKNIPGMAQRNRFQEHEQAENVFQTIKKIIRYFTTNKGLLIACFLVVILGTLCGIYAPSLQSKAIDIISDEAKGNLNFTIILMLIIYLLYSIFSLLQSLISAKLSQKIVKQLREELFGKLVDLPVKYLDTHSHGDVMSRMTNDVENLSTTISQSLPSLFSGILTIIGTVGIMVYYCWQLALLSLFTVILTVAATKILSSIVRKSSRKRQEYLGKLNGTVEEKIAGYHTVVAYNHQQTTIEEFNKTSDLLTKEGIKTDIFSGIMGPIMNSIGNVGFVIIAAFGGYFAINGLISIGIISAFIVYAKQFSKPINEIAQIYGQIQTAIAGAERVFNVLDEKNEDKDGEKLKVGNDAEVVFENVNFSYDSISTVLHDFSLTIRPGEKVAFVGATGSGKTTVVNLLMRYYDCDSGKILINNQDITKISRESLRENVSIVLQDTVLFTDTIKNNLKFASENATEEQIDSALKMSRCDEFIQKLPNGIGTILENAGDNISQGQRQLLAIARAFVADPKILILDEATSNVDTRTEKAIQDAMHKIMENRTSIVIAHRLSTIEDADKIVVLDKGNIVEIGTHNELINRKGKYYELYITQYKGFVT